MFWWVHSINQLTISILPLDTATTFFNYLHSRCKLLSWIQLGAGMKNPTGFNKFSVAALSLICNLAIHWTTSWCITAFVTCTRFHEHSIFRLPLICMIITYCERFHSFKFFLAYKHSISRFHFINSRIKLHGYSLLRNFINDFTSQIIKIIKL